MEKFPRLQRVAWAQGSAEGVTLWRMKTPPAAGELDKIEFGSDTHRSLQNRSNRRCFGD